MEKDELLDTLLKDKLEQPYPAIILQPGAFADKEGRGPRNEMGVVQPQSGWAGAGGEPTQRMTRLHQLGAIAHRAEGPALLP